MFKSYLCGRSVTVHSSNAIVERSVNKSCPQGSVLGPVLWNVNYECFVKEVVKEMDCCCIVYADDLIVLVRCFFRREIEDLLQEVIRTVEDTSSKLCLKMSWKKTEAIMLKGNLDADRSPILKMYGRTIKFKRRANT